MPYIMFLFLFWTLPAFAGVGVFTETTGEVRIQRADAWLVAAPGVDVEADDIVETGANAETQMDMKDGSVFRLGANSRMLLSEYNLDRDNSVISAGVEMLNGWLRFAVARLRSTERHFNIQTPTMTVGIRGTEGVLETGNERNGLLMEEGHVEVEAPGTKRGTVRAGQFIEHRPGVKRFRPSPPPKAFRERLPRSLQARAERRAHLLKQRNVAPRHLRALTNEDRERFQREHPHRQKLMEKRFEKRRLNPGAARDGKSSLPAKPADRFQPGALAPGKNSSSQEKKQQERQKRINDRDEKKPEKKKPEKRDRDERRSAVPGEFQG